MQTNPEAAGGTGNGPTGVLKPVGQARPSGASATAPGLRGPSARGAYLAWCVKAAAQPSHPEGALGTTASCPGLR